jgi:hypothetical protein
MSAHPLLWQWIQRHLRDTAEHANHTTLTTEEQATLAKIAEDSAETRERLVEERRVLYVRYLRDTGRIGG